MDANSIFDAFERISSLSEIVENRRRKCAQLRGLKAKVCGNCDHWMKSSCGPEKEEKQFKSCGSIACCDFKIKSWVSEKIDVCSLELKEIESSI